MPTEGISIEFDGEAKLDVDLKRLSLFIADLRPFWPLVVPMFIGWMRLQFETEGEFSGRGKWAPLTEDYARWKAQRYPGKGILIAEGDLRRAASMPRRITSPRALILRVEDPKVAYHQEGTDRMKARPLLFGEPLPPIAAAELRHAAERYITDIVRRVGLAGRRF